MKQVGNQSGATFLEVLVSLLIVAIGLLGQMTLQMTSISSNQSSYYRSQAAILANDFIDRMRLNSDGVEAGNYNNIALDSSSNNGDPGCATNGCSAAQLAQLDIYEMQEHLQELIPGGTFSVTRNAAILNQAVFRLTITWQIEDRAGLTNGANVNQVALDFGV